MVFNIKCAVVECVDLTMSREIIFRLEKILYNPIITIRYTIKVNRGSVFDLH